MGFACVTVFGTRLVSSSFCFIEAAVLISLPARTWSLGNDWLLMCGSSALLGGTQGVGVSLIIGIALGDSVVAGVTADHDGNFW